MLATMLFREDFETEAMSCLEEGRVSFTPDRYLFECVIKHHCKRNQYVPLHT